jgi:hypothetical protein
MCIDNKGITPSEKERIKWDFLVGIVSVVIRV